MKKLSKYLPISAVINLPFYWFMALFVQGESGKPFFKYKDFHTPIWIEFLVFFIITTSVLALVFQFVSTLSTNKKKLFYLVFGILILLLIIHFFNS